MKELTQSPQMLDKMELYHQLDIERTVVIDPDSGEWAGNLSWRRIDELLDCLNELNILNQYVRVFHEDA